MFYQELLIHASHQAGSEGPKFELIKSVNIVLADNPVFRPRVNSQKPRVNPRKPRRNESLQLDTVCLLVSGISGIKPPLQSQILKNG